jgi:GT2 family glycosyltransferase
METDRIAVVIPNWNGLDELPDCLLSLRKQTVSHKIFVVENGSTDRSLAYLSRQKDVETIVEKENLGFAGGVNAGINIAMQQGYNYIALLNNDAIADKNWLKQLKDEIQKDQFVGIATSKMLNSDGKHIDDTGDFYTNWGLPFPRGRLETDLNKYDGLRDVFAASGGASLYRTAMFKEIGLFDEDFFAYYEDVDISFRAQLMGWKIRYSPESIVYHNQGSTSGKIKGFTTYQTFKNYPLLLIKNVPSKLLPNILLHHFIAYASIYFSSIVGGRGWHATKGMLRMLTLLPKKLSERHNIQKSRKVSVDYIKSIIIYDLPPNAYKLRRLRDFFVRKNNPAKPHQV